MLSGRTLQKEESCEFFPAEIKPPVFRQRSMLNSHVLCIAISLFRSRGSTAALSLNQYGEFAVDGREIAVLPECRFLPSAAVSSLSGAEKGATSAGCFSSRSGFFCAHRKGAVLSSPCVHAFCTTLLSNSYAFPLIPSDISFWCVYPMLHFSIL